MPGAPSGDQRNSYLDQPAHREATAMIRDERARARARTPYGLPRATCRHLRGYDMDPEWLAISRSCDTGVVTAFIPTTNERTACVVRLDRELVLPDGAGADTGRELRGNCLCLVLAHGGTDWATCRDGRRAPTPRAVRRVHTGTSCNRADTPARRTMASRTGAPDALGSVDAARQRHRRRRAKRRPRPPCPRRVSHARAKLAAAPSLGVSVRVP